MKTDIKDQSNIDNLIEKLGEIPQWMSIAEFGINLKYRNGCTVDVGNIVTILKVLSIEFQKKMKIIDFDIQIKDKAGYCQRVQTSK